MIDAMPSAPTLPLGGAVPAVHAAGQRSALPMNAYLMSDPATVACVCQPQYCVQNPDVSFTSADVSTKYTAFVSLGSRPLVIAADTTARTPPSLSAVPCE